MDRQNVPRGGVISTNERAPQVASRNRDNLADHDGRAEILMIRYSGDRQAEPRQTLEADSCGVLQMIEKCEENEWL